MEDELTLAELLAGPQLGDGTMPSLSWLDEYDDDDDYVDPEITGRHIADDEAEYQR